MDKFAVLCYNRHKEKKMSKEFETVAYTKLKHIRVFINNIIYRNFHLHGETEILYVVSGSCAVNLAGRAISAAAGDIILLNPHESHEIVSGGDGADFIVLQLSRHLFREYYPAMESSYFSENDVGKALGGKKTEFWQIGRAHV